MAVLSMFPLGSVLFPHGWLPLRVFEPRYRQMITELLVGNGEFGVTLIERGSEVGGGDTRSLVGTRARIVQAGENPDGSWFVVAVGVGRIRITEWLPDGPYPRAEVEDWPDREPRPEAEAVNAVVGRLRQLLAMKSELGDPAVPATVELADEPEIALWQACAVAPVGPLDEQRLLAAPGTRARLDVLVELLTDEADVARRRLAT